MVHPLVVRDIRDGTLEIIGSCFVVACSGHDALMISAKHNFDWAPPTPIDRSHPSSPFRSPPPSLWEIENRIPHTIAFANGEGIPSRVLDVSLHPEFDLAVFHARLPENGPAFSNQIGFDSTSPSAGEAVICLGYCNMKWSTEKAAEDTVDVFDFPLKARYGNIHELTEGRNRAPVARLNLAIDSGMSGGPIVKLRDGRPYAFAVATSDWSFTRESMQLGGGLSEGTLLTSLLDVVAPRQWGENSPDGPRLSIRDLRACGLLTDIDGAS